MGQDDKGERRKERGEKRERGASELGEKLPLDAEGMDASDRDPIQTIQTWNDEKNGSVLLKARRGMGPSR